MVLAGNSQPAEETPYEPEACQQEAEALYRSGSHNCAEAVMESIRRTFVPEVPEAIVSSVAGFGGGSGTGCICGAVSGGTVALGLILQEKKLTAQMTKAGPPGFRPPAGRQC